MRSRTGRGPVRRIVLAVALALATIGGTALAVGTANAGISGFTDGFDDNPASRWSMERTSLGGTITFGSSHVTISAHQKTGFTAVKRTFPVPAVGRHTCAVSIQMRTMSSASIRVNVEVIDPATFGYLALNEATVSGQTWREFNASWANRPVTEVL